MHARVADHYPRTTFHTASNPTVTLVRNGPLNTACRTLIEESSGCEDDQAALQGAENRSCLAQVMRSGTVGLGGVSVIFRCRGFSKARTGLPREHHGLAGANALREA